jgi:hypothetical protein
MERLLDGKEEKKSRANKNASVREKKTTDRDDTTLAITWQKERPREGMDVDGGKDLDCEKLDA